MKEFSFTQFNFTVRRDNHSEQYEIQEKKFRLIQMAYFTLFQFFKEEKLIKYKSTSNKS